METVGERNKAQEPKNVHCQQYMYNNALILNLRDMHWQRSTPTLFPTFWFAEQKHDQGEYDKLPRSRRTSSTRDDSLWRHILVDVAYYDVVALLRPTALHPASQPLPKLVRIRTRQMKSRTSGVGR